VAKPPYPEDLPRKGDFVDVGALHHVDDFEDLARQMLPEATYGYVAGGAGDETSVRRNREVLDQVRLVPRVLRDVSNVTTSTTLLGQETAWPLMIAPSAVQRLADPEGELATARAARDRGLTMILSMNASTPVEDVCRVGASCWMQLYVSPDRGHMREIVQRAVAAGVRALCVTVDHAGMPTRLRELRRPLEIPDHIQFAHLPADRAGSAIDRSLDWESLDWLREEAGIPIVLKGVLAPDDARLAADRGLDGVIVSNHGGRQLDGVVAPYEVLPAVVEAVAGRIEVYVDGGIRSGPDLMKALALGARAGLIGRPMWWGLAAAGEEGARRVLSILCDDFAEAMRLCGVGDVESIGADLVWGVG
jgi:4-hydroxymandelate oxidase